MASRMSRTAAKRRSSTILRAANSGSRRKLLVALRNKIAKDLDEGSVQSRDLASLSKRLVDITAEIERIDRGESKDNPVAEALDTAEEMFDDGEGED